MMLIAAARPPRQSFLRGPVHGLLRGRVGVDRGHQTGLDADAFLEQHVDHRREAVRGAGGVRHDVVLGRVVLVLVHAHEQRLDVALARGGDDDLLGAGREVALGLLGVGEEAGRLDHVVDAQRLPGQLARLLGGHDALDLVAVDDQHVVVLRRGARSSSAETACLKRPCTESYFIW